MKEITINIDGKEIKATVSEEEIEKLTRQEPSSRVGFAGSILKKMREKEWPQIGDRYYWTIIDGSLRDKIFEGNPDEETLISNGNMYRTKQEALDAVRARKLITAIAKRRKELNGDWIPVDEDKSFAGYCIVYYEGDYITFNSAYLNTTGAPFGIYKYIDYARTIIEEFKDELLWFFTEYLVSVN